MIQFLSQQHLSYCRSWQPCLKEASFLAHKLGLRVTINSLYQDKVYFTEPKAPLPLEPPITRPHSFPRYDYTEDGFKRCLMLWGRVYINANGMIFPCCAPEQRIMGSIDDLSFEDIWNNEFYQTMRKTFTGGPGSQHCLKCARKGFLANS